MKPNKTLIQFLKYMIVGGIATVVEWIFFYILCNIIRINYMLSTAFAFMLSTFANWLAGRIIMFQASGNTWGELGKIYLTSAGGLLFNLGFMWLFVDCAGFMEMLSKMIVTAIVFIWNFLIRKCLIYKD